jgi:hypothetical protein
MLKGTGKPNPHVPSKIDLKTLGDLIAECGAGPEDIAMPFHRVVVPPVQRAHPHTQKTRRKEWQSQFMTSVYEQCTGLDSLHLNRRRERIDGKRHHVIEPLDGNTRLTALIGFYNNEFGIGPTLDGHMVYYSDVTSPTRACRVMHETEREWCDKRLIPVIWYDDVPPALAASIFVGLNRFKTPITNNEIVSALVQGSENPSLVRFRAACETDAFNGIVQTKLLDASLVRNLQTFLSTCTCIASWDPESPAHTSIVNTSFIDQLNDICFEGTLLPQYDKLTTALPEIVQALTKARSIIIRHSIRLGVRSQGGIQVNRRLAIPEFLSIVYAILYGQCDEQRIESAFTTLAHKPFSPEHKWYTLCRSFKTVADCASGAQALTLIDPPSNGAESNGAETCV